MSYIEKVKCFTIDALAIMVAKVIATAGNMSLFVYKGKKNYICMTH